MSKYQRRFARFDEAVVSLHATGMSTGDIQAHLAASYSPRGIFAVSDGKLRLRSDSGK